MLDLSRMKELHIGGIKLAELYIKGLRVWKSGVKNWVPLSIDTDGSVFDGIGYREGCRLSSSGALSAQANTVTSGFIPCSSTDVIRMAGVNWIPTPTDQYCYLMFFDAGFNVIGSISGSHNSSYPDGRTIYRGYVVSNKEGDGNKNVPSISGGVTTFDNYKFSANADKVAYFRINGYGEGPDMIVTVNEEVV